MKQYLNTIRTPIKNRDTLQHLENTLLILLLGIGLGISSKWLDMLSINDEIWWQHVIGMLDLGNIFSLFGIWILLAVAISIYSNSPLRAGINVFIFFLSMNIAYHIYTIIFAGFNPRSYMLIWYGITAFSPFLAAICWYAKGNGPIPILIRAGILAVMTLFSFSIGMWYFDCISVIDTLFFLLMLGILYDSPKKSMISLIGGLLLSYFIRIFI